MICTEVGELMQRQLDHDLDEQELTTLMTHLGECEACQHLFERLTLLSGSLEQLPRVTPSISIVDSILPELEAIDRQRSQQRQKRGQWKRWMTASASVAAAAAVVFVMSNLAGNSNQANNSAPEVAMSYDSSTASGQYDIMSMSGDARNFAGEMTEDSYSYDEAANGYHIAPLSSPIESLRKDWSKQDQLSEPGSGELKGSVDSQMSSNGGEAQQQVTTTTKSTAVGGQRSESGQGEGGSQPVDELSIVPEDQSGNSSSVQNEATITSDGDNNEKELSPSINSINKFDAVDKHLSPDGKVYIAFEGHTIVLYETSSEQQLYTWDIEGGGTASFVQWSADNSSFVYAVTSEAGESINHTVTVKQ